MHNPAPPAARFPGYAFVWVLALFFLPALACGIESPRAEPVAILPPEAASGQDPAAQPTVPASENTQEPAIPAPASPEALVEPTHIPPTPTPGLASSSFSPASASQDLPDNVMEELMFFGGQGGGGGAEGFDVCEEAPSGRISVMWEPDDEIPLFEWNTALLCGWEPYETVAIEITLPDGSVRQESAQAEDFGEVYYQLRAEYTDLPGRYRYSFAGPGGGLELVIDRTPMTAPGVYRRYDRPKKLLLYGYRPGETVRFFLYEPYDADGYFHRLSGWQAYTIGPDGRLLITLDVADPERVRYEAVGESGSFEAFSLAGCDDGPRLRRGDQVWVSAPDGVELYRRETMAEAIYYSAPGDFFLPYGAEATIIGGPICFEFSVMWEIRTPDGAAGVVGEDSYAGDRQLERGEPPAGAQSGAFTCPGAPPARLESGGTARVTITNGLPVRIRAKPGFAGEQTGKLPEGDEMEILDGPFCMDGYVWYRIEAEDGQTGWMTEGDEDGYFLEPWP